MAHYEPVNGIYRKVTKHCEPVEGVHRNVTKAYKPVDGVYRQYFSSGIPASALAVGDSVWLNVNGVLTEFLVVHQGNPDSKIYPSSCKGTWLLMKDTYGSQMFDAGEEYEDQDGELWLYGDARYQESDIHNYLNNTFLKLLSSGVQSSIKQARIPYYHWGVNESHNNAVVKYGSNGLSTKIFLLSVFELGGQSSWNADFVEDGASLDYFSGTAYRDAKRIAYYNGTAVTWWTRSAGNYYGDRVYIVDKDGRPYQPQVTYYQQQVRPALILNSSTLIDQSTGVNIIA